MVISTDNDEIALLFIPNEYKLHNLGHLLRKQQNELFSYRLKNYH